MSGRTWLMMALVLAINWGGFIVMLIHGTRREAQKRRAAPDARDGLSG